jgi:hypothetical protein
MDSRKCAGVVEDSLTGIHNKMVKCLFVVNRNCVYRVFLAPTGKNPENSNVAIVEAMLWVLIYLSVGHGTCY